MDRANGSWYARLRMIGGVTAPGTVGRRTHVAGVFHDGKFRLFVDGKLVGTKPVELGPSI